MQPLGAAVLVLAVAHIHWGSTELAAASVTTSSHGGDTTTQSSQDNEATKPRQSAVTPGTASLSTDNDATPTSINASLNVTSVLNSTEASAQGRTPLSALSNATEEGSTEKITAVSTNTTSVPDTNSTLLSGRGSSSTESIRDTHQDTPEVTSRIPGAREELPSHRGPTEIGIKTEPTIKLIDYSKTTQPLQDSDLSSAPTPSTLEKTRYIAPAVMVPILLVGAVSFIVWKMCQSDPPGSDQNDASKYVSKTGSVQLLSVRTTTPQADGK